MGVAVLRTLLLLAPSCLQIFELILPFDAATLLQNFHWDSRTTQGKTNSIRLPSVARTESVNTGPVYPSSGLEVMERLSNVFPFLSTSESSFVFPLLRVLIGLSLVLFPGFLSSWSINHCPWVPLMAYLGLASTSCCFFEHWVAYCHFFMCLFIVFDLVEYTDCWFFILVGR